MHIGWNLDTVWTIPEAYCGISGEIKEKAKTYIPKVLSLNESIQKIKSTNILQ